MRRRSAPLCAFVLASLLGSPAAFAASAEASAARAEFLAAAKLTPDTRRGARSFETCAACHGTAGQGLADGSVPAIAGQHGSVLLKQLVDFRHEQRWNERMQHFSDRHHLQGAQDLTDVAAYVAQLPRFPPMADSVGDGAFLQQGARAYFQVCADCHGRLGEGDVLKLRPRLAGQRYEYLLLQLRETAAGNRPGMDPEHVRRLRRLKSEELRGVADYLSRLSPDLATQPVRRPTP
ncbi:MAG: c-type cytochrome [Steroidobacteraceae bacterium]